MKLKVPSVPAVMGSDYGREICTAMTVIAAPVQHILGKRFGIIRVILCKWPGGCSRIQVILGQEHYGFG